MKTVTTLTRLTLVAAVMGMSGCLYDFDFGEDTWEEDPYYYGEYTELEASAALLDGELGLVQVDGDARIYEASDFGYGASIELRSEGLGGTGMNRLNIDGVSIAELEPGTYESTGYYTTSGTGDPNFSVTGCSGPSDGNWDYDVGADYVQVVVTEVDPWTVRIDWTATFPETYTYGRGEPTEIPSNTSTGSVVVVR
ncbi:MAG: hypothetical protein JJ863_02425 [Deltaproteobacteria bacterium]|nr:hypothetical protein [Deltaproteobacteria bacterium]